MKKKITSMLSIVMLLTMLFPTLTAFAYSPQINDGIILEEYSLADSDIVFTMELFEETYTRQDVANMIALKKANESPETYQYRNIAVSEAEIDEVYENMEALAARSPGINYYFSNIYWQYRTDSYYGPNTISLTLVTTEATRNNREVEVTMAAWALVKAQCSSSPHWTNEGSLEQQFRCHALGEIWYSGDVGNWDLEPIRPDVGLIEYAVNKCNPTG